MISAKEALNKVKEIKEREEIERSKRQKEEAKSRDILLKKAKKDTLPSTLQVIEETINRCIENKETSLYFTLLPWMQGELLQKEIVKELTEAGFKVKDSSWTPTEGGDPDSGEGAYQCGPTVYRMDISWK